jgi:SET domain-containing protein
VTKTKPKRKSTPARTKTKPAIEPAVSFRLRRSPVHGTGVFATRAIPKGEMVIRYVGERITHAEADRRHAVKSADDAHTFLFTIDAKTVIDAGVGGNDSRFINHSCAPNCEVELVRGWPVVEAIRDIAKGEELAYDYNLTREDADPPEIEKLFACRCGAASCRGSMLAPPRKKRAAPKKSSPRSKAKPKRARRI